MAFDPFGAAASVVGSIIGGVAANKAQKSANETNLKIARETNEAQLNAMRENNEFNRNQAIEMFNMENAYNDPLAQSQRLSAAGINPRNVLGSGGSMAVGQVDTPTAASSGVNMVSPQVAPVPSILGSAMNNFETLARSLQNLASAKKAGAETKLVEMTADEQLKKIGLENESTQLANDYQKVMNKYADTRQAQEINQLLQKINNLQQEAVLNVKEGNYKDALVQVQNETRELVKSNRVLNEKQKDLLQKDLDAYDVRLSLEKMYQKAAANEKNASAYQHRKQGDLAAEQATTELEFREDRKAILSDERAMYHLERVFQSETQIERLQKYLADIEMTEAQRDLLRKQLEKVQKDLDWYDIEKFNKMVQDYAGVALDAFNGSLKLRPVKKQTTIHPRKGGGKFIEESSYYE